MKGKLKIYKTRIWFVAAGEGLEIKAADCVMERWSDSALNADAEAIRDAEGLPIFVGMDFDHSSTNEMRGKTKAAIKKLKDLGY